MSMMTPILAQISLMKEGCLALEEPEMSLRPEAQMELTNFLAEMICENPKVQCMIDTHSEYVMIQLSRLVKFKKLPNEAVSTSYFLKTDGIHDIAKIGLENDGAFSKPWPGGFFSQRLN